MSTKATIARADGFHFYHECFDADHVYLELRGDDLNFEVSPGNATFRIPLSIWEAIRRTGATDFGLVMKTDLELKKLVEKAVDERIAKYEQIKRENQPAAFFLGWGLQVYGSADDPRRSQIRKGMNFYRQERERQRNILREMKNTEVVEHKRKAEHGEELDWRELLREVEKLTRSQSAALSQKVAKVGKT